MPSESSGLNQSLDQALRELSSLREFQGGAREFWPRYTTGVGQLTAANKVAVLARQTVDETIQWRKIGEWVAGGGTSRLLVQFTAGLEDTAQRCTAQGNLAFPMEPIPSRGYGHFVLAVRLVLARPEDVCIALCLLSEVNEAAAQEG